MKAIKIAVTVLTALVAVPFGLGTDERPRRKIDDGRLLERLNRTPNPAVESVSGAAITFPSAIPDGASWLATEQNPSGSWGTAFEFVDTATVVDTLGTVQSSGLAFSRGVNWLTGQASLDNDEMSRKILALRHVNGLALDDFADQLLATRNTATSDPLAPNFPEGGWGLEDGFETDSLTSALALLALEAAGRKAGIAVEDEPVAAAATNVHEWEIADDATKARIVISVTGSVELRMTQGSPPTGGEPFFGLSNGTFNIVFPDSGLPFTPGANFISVRSTGAPATYSFVASYETPDFDTRSFAEAVDYLRAAQNVDGGWGLQTGDVTSFFTTLHVMLALLEWGDYDFDAELSSAITYLLGQQLPDGSFGFAATPVPYLTALGALNLIRFDVCPFDTATDDAVAALVAQQAVDGSWDQEPYDTGLAMTALFEYDSDGDGVFADGDCSGMAGDNLCTEGNSMNCDDNCVDFPNSGQGGVVFGQTVSAQDQSSFSWPNPVDVAFVKGPLADVGTYGVSGGGAASQATSISSADDNPAASEGLYYLVRLAGECSTSSWQTSLGAEPGRDAAPLGELEIAITSPADGAVLSASPATVSGTVDGAEPINVTVNGVAATVGGGTFSASVPLARGANTITAVGTDAASFMGMDQISVTLVDFSIPLNSNATGSRIFTGPASEIAQTAFFTETQIGVPAGVVYTTTGVSIISATEVKVDFQIDATGAAAPGIYFFQVEYGLLDAAMNPLGPLTGNTFDFQIQITP
jgi:hypothetical protein